MFAALCQEAGVEPQIVLAALDTDRVEAQGAARGADQLARQITEQFAAPRRQSRAAHLGGRPARHEQRYEVALRFLRIVGGQGGLERRRRALQSECDLRVAHARHRPDVEIRLDRVRVAEVDRALIAQAVPVAAEKGEAALGEHRTPCQSRLSHGSHEPHVGTHGESGIVVVDKQVVLCQHAHVEPQRIEWRGRPGLDGARGSLQRLEQPARQRERLTIRAARQADGAGNDRPSRLDSKREVGVGFGAQAVEIDGAAAAAEHHFAVERREPPVAHGAADLRLPPVDAGPDPFERHGVAGQRDGARQIAHDDSRVDEAQLAIAERDVAVESRRIERAADAELGVGASPEAGRAREDAQEAQVDRARRGDAQNGVRGKRRAAGERHTVVACPPQPIGDVEASVAEQETRRLLLVERHAGDRKLGAAQRHRSTKVFESGAVGLELDR